MGWESRNGRGRYYTRSVRRNGKVCREYRGCGWLAELAEQLDTIERQRRETDLARHREQREQARQIDADIGEVIGLADALAAVMLLSAGYHRHDRGDWRLRRGAKGQGTADTAD